MRTIPQPVAHAASRVGSPNPPFRWVADQRWVGTTHPTGFARARAAHDGVIELMIDPAALPPAPRSARSGMPGKRRGKGDPPPRQQPLHPSSPRRRGWRRSPSCHGLAGASPRPAPLPDHPASGDARPRGRDGQEPPHPAATHDRHAGPVDLPPPRAHIL
jgi:hypothetical protein